MTYRYLFVAAALLLTTAAGCSDNAETGCVDDGDCREGRVCAFSVCEPAEESASDDAAAPGEDSPGDVSRGDSVEAGAFQPFVWSEEDGPLSGVGRCDCVENGGTFRVVLFLEHDGSALAFYEEGVAGHGFNPTSESGFGSVDSRRRYAFDWSVVGDELKVGPWLSCRLSEDSDSSRLYCESLKELEGIAAGEEFGFARDFLLDGLGKNPNDESYDPYTPAP